MVFHDIHDKSQESLDELLYVSCDSKVCCRFMNEVAGKWKTKSWKNSATTILQIEHIMKHEAQHDCSRNACNKKYWLVFYIQKILGLFSLKHPIRGADRSGGFAPTSSGSSVI